MSNNLKRETANELLYESEHIQILFMDCGSDMVVATFNPSDRIADGNAIWGDTFFQKLSISVLGFVTKKQSWFPYDDMVRGIAEVSSRIAGKSVITYGYSQGAYGALKYAHALSAQATLAFSPQWSINPSDVGEFDVRYTHYFNDGLKNGRKIEAGDLAPRSFIFFDPLEPHDRENAKHLLALPGIEKILVPFTKHSTIYLLSEAKMSSALLTYALQTAQIEASRLRRFIRQSRRNSPTYKGQLALELFKRAHTQLTRKREPQNLLPFFKPSFGQKQTSFPWMKTLSSLHSKPINDVYLAIEQFLLGQSNVADKLISQITDELLLETDLGLLSEIFSAVKFETAKARVLPLFKIKYASNIDLQLSAIVSMLQSGLNDIAENRLIEIIEAGLPPHLSYYAVDIMVLLGKPEKAFDLIVYYLNINMNGNGAVILAWLKLLENLILRENFKLCMDLVKLKPKFPNLSDEQMVSFQQKAALTLNKTFNSPLVQLN